VSDRRLSQLADAIVGTVQAIVDRGQRAPSRDVQMRAAGMIVAAGVPSRAVVVEVEGSERRHPVALYTRGTQRRAGKTIVAARCWCDHQGSLDDEQARVCSHILAALSVAWLDGYRIEV
jgi:hypothetical protein